jgi:hypothetical protein
LGLWLAATFWAIAWIDKQELIDFPGRTERSIARLIWSASPALDHSRDAERALKFSWLRVTGDISNKDRKGAARFIAILKKESVVLDKYLKLHGKLLPEDIQLRFAVQLLTYLNRVELFGSTSNPALDATLKEFDKRIESTHPTLQENWYREMMIRAKLQSNDSLYSHYRQNLLHEYEDGADDISAEFIRGVINFYDGVLSCAVQENQEAAPLLNMAAKNLSGFPRYTLNFLKGDLNVILLGKGIKGGGDCNELIRKIIQLGK